MATAKAPLWKWREPTDWKPTRFEEVQVTPELAEYIYDNLGDFNRKISAEDPKVREYATDMIAGRWGKIGLVEFDWNGRLSNGYHRMLAVILSGITVTMFFRYGADPKDYVGYDKGKNRDGQDTLEVEAREMGETITAADANLLATSIPWIVLYECGKASIKNIPITSYFQRDFYRKRFSKKGEDFAAREMLPLARKAAKALGCAESVVFALMVLGSRIPLKIGLTRAFWQAVASGVGMDKASDPRLQFVNRIKKIREEAHNIHAKLQRGPVYLYGLKCMRDYFYQKEIKLLMPQDEIVRLSPDHDEMFDKVNIDFENPHGEATVFEAANMLLVEQLVAKHEGRGKK